jgi:hypothetical protein
MIELMSLFAPFEAASAKRVDAAVAWALMS